MKSLRLIFSLALILFFFNSCSDKEEPRPNYNYSFKVNGVLKEFTASRDADVTFITNQGSGGRTTIFTMVTGDSPETNAISLLLRTNTSIEVGRTYQMQLPLQINEVLVPSIVLQYLDEDGNEYVAYLLQSENPGAQDDANVTINIFNDEGTIGTFEGVVFDANDQGPLGQRTPLLITEGRFFLPNFIL